MARAVEAVREALNQGVPGVLGIHFEGPHINLARRGAHDAREIGPLGDDDIDLLASLGTGRTLVTLAPESVEVEQYRRDSQRAGSSSPPATPRPTPLPSIWRRRN